MKYANPHRKKVKNSHLLLVSCQTCKADLAIYYKVGRGNLIKLQVHRIHSANFPLASLDKALVCPSCGQQVASLAAYKGKPCYFLFRALTTTRRLSSHDVY
ncbi:MULTISPECIES: hypothetical protein [Aerococcus]|uniref:Uncharacterized protein n=1 Tax=Aerococcus sanguinicola TaxID=119206 RepID=A0A5N1GIV3_9LACT|nr:MULTISPECIES: hypothetical protein [Aerococcus]KAA9300324.1 hypothetical protein F6I03_07785 [Aerococcus sanguinicola]MDK6369873.1 hypothetical protein [Aerococcus sp. UMB9870]MDK6678851.1 hypothetical protein [Aerococcus sp. UMB8608]MDK6686831.1 hypothetical protein [Aerococcus sp. UMB8623]MDK6939509.1 hypothetical protein [Aerococcus sp. UMB8487]